MKTRHPAARWALMTLLLAATACLSACGGAEGDGAIDPVSVDGEGAPYVRIRNDGDSPSPIVEVYGRKTYTNEPFSWPTRIRPTQTEPFPLEPGHQYEFNIVYEDGTGPRGVDPRPVFTPGESGKLITFYW